MSEATPAQALAMQKVRRMFNQWFMETEEKVKEKAAAELNSQLTDPPGIADDL